MPGAEIEASRRTPPPQHLRTKLDREDIAQDAALRAVRAADRAGVDLRSLDENELRDRLNRAFSWARNDQIRPFDRSRRRASRERSLNAPRGDATPGLGELLPSDHTSPTGRVRRAEDLARLTEAVELLPHDQREAIRLRDLGGRSLKETADAMGKTPRSAIGLISPGLATLRQKLGEEP